MKKKTPSLFSLTAIVLTILKLANLIEISWKAIIGIWLVPVAIVVVNLILLGISFILISKKSKD